ncbi:hypothetical protein [Pantoea agglomerans]|uniref:hypothetical protein n=1 Tax=Enterobacter agglomerans TaxID=549 RepID=UPI0032083D02
MQFLLEKSAGRHLFYSAMVILPENNTGYKNSVGAMLTPAGWHLMSLQAGSVIAQLVAQCYPQEGI